MKKTKKNIEVTGKVDKCQDLLEIISGKRESRFSKWNTKESYKAHLYDLTHVELVEEVMRVGATPSCEKEICRNRCLDAYHRYKNPRGISLPTSSNKKLEDIIN